MKTPTLAACASLGLIVCVWAQEPAPTPQPGPTPLPPPPIGPPMPGAQGSDDALQNELTALFGKVERRLHAIDAQMYEAASGRVPVKAIAGSGLEELLRAGSEASMPKSVGGVLDAAQQDIVRVQSDIERILEIAEQLSQQKKGGQGQGQGQGGQGQSGRSPLDSQQSGREGERENTPTSPDSGNPDGQKDGQGDQPKDGGHDDPNDPAHNQAGAPPSADKLGPGSRGDGNDRWGDLPVRAREVFRVEGASDLPPQYRDWIDGYYRRLQSLERR